MKREGLAYLAFFGTGLIWSVFVLWIGFYPLLAGTAILFDIFVTRRVDWTLRRYRLPRWLLSAVEWMVVIVLAILLSVSLKVLFLEAYKIPTPSMEETLMTGDFIFVSKLAYGPRLPMTPLAIPFYHNKLPSGKKSYSQAMEKPYKRLHGISRVRRNDIIVFNFPEGDSMVMQYPGQNYYSLVRQYGHEYIHSQFDVASHPVDKRENFVKRCLALPGDTLQIAEGKVFVNGQPGKEMPDQIAKHYVTTFGKALADSFLDSLKILKSGITYNPANSLHVLYLTTKQAELLQQDPAVRSIKRYVEPMLSFQNQEIFPHDSRFRWTGDHFGPLVVPARGMSLEITPANLPLYRRIIEVYENHTLVVQDGEIRIDGQKTNRFTFAMDYYFVMGDNRHNSADSRYWGFVPEDHLLGKAVMVWFSVDPETRFVDGFRKERIFKIVK